MSEIKKIDKTNVEFERWRYVGGSDIPIILGHSPFKTREQLVMEKANEQEVEQITNDYIDYGNYAEPYIREFINQQLEISGGDFHEDTFIVGNERANVDGINDDYILEIKTTNSPKFEMYDDQMEFYFKITGYTKGKLVVVERPKNFKELTKNDINMIELLENGTIEYKVYDVSKDESKVDFIEKEIAQFWKEVEYYKENKEIILQQQHELSLMAKKVLETTQTIKEYESVVQEQREKLYDAMEKCGILRIKLPDEKISVSLIPPKEEGVNKVVDFDLETFKLENKELYEKYVYEIDKKTPAKKGFIQIKTNERSQEIK